MNVVNFIKGQIHESVEKAAETVILTMAKWIK